jgi:hypothetical protein
MPLVQSQLQGRDLYAFVRKTHVSLARGAGVHQDAVYVQVGHTRSDTEGRHYLDTDMIDASRSSQAVYDLVSQRAAPAKVLRLAVGGEAESDVAEVFREKSAARGPSTRRARPRGEGTCKESHLWDLNPGPTLYESVALPLS